ncbi:MAG: ankyrin repeat domain-containing protein [Candidatus Binatia bacterium]
MRREARVAVLAVLAFGAGAGRTPRLLRRRRPRPRSRRRSRPPCRRRRARPRPRSRRQWPTAALVEAARAGDTAAVTNQVKGGTGVNTANAAGVTALMGAAQGAHRDTVEALIPKMKAAVNAHDAEGATALQQAAEVGAPGVVTTLLARGADVNARSPKGWTTLMAAASVTGGTPGWSRNWSRAAPTSTPPTSSG